MTNAEQREAARRFINNWRGKGYEKGDTQRFWMSLLYDVLDMDNVADKIEFEKEVVIDGQTKFIDGYIAETKVLIEQKSLNKDLNKAIPQSGGKLLTPYEQAKNYANNLPVDEAPRWIVTCNFEEFHVYDMNKPGAEPEIILLENLQTELYRFSFLFNEKNDNISKEMEISIQAGDLVGDLYDALLKEYKDPDNEDSLKSLNALCVRLVFCLYAEDAGIFGRHGMFHDYLMRFEIRDLRKALIELFQVLDIKPEDRDPYMDEDLAAFPYVNGGLFSDANIEIPQLTEKIRELILKKASEDFDWSEISPTIFGAVFESTLNPETRRAGGMHYTSIENIHKVIDPLFLDALKDELEEIRTIAVAKTKKAKLEVFHNKLAGLSFLDPACGSGNFLTESYVALRKIENEVLKMKMEVEKGQVAGQIMLGDLAGIENPIKVSIGQFYGIEINDFAVTVAKTALWIAESQMMKATEDIIHLNLDFLPLKSYANIVEGNALRMDWNDVVSKDELDYIMGNPPFVGARWMNKEQKKDMEIVFHGIKDFGNLDFVTAWYKKASDYILNTKILVSFVSTNTITQGEQPAIFWKPLFDMGIHINYAYRTFRWDSEANLKAHVHCVIVGFSHTKCNKDKIIFDTNGEARIVKNINAYLIDADDIFVASRNHPICKVPEIGIGNKPIDGGYYLFDKDEMETFIRSEPKAKQYFRPWYGAREFINQQPRYCLYL
ncbi:MAG: N-6 DNA methylase, partial [Bacillota bacterium]|nr:N-6 DNA methylase [Bacillota bacterium]